MRNKKQSAHRKFTISPRLRYGAMSTAIVALVIVALILINLATTNLETRYGAATFPSTPSQRRARRQSRFCAT